MAKDNERREKLCYTLPLGPQHPMYVEAENLMVRVDGETITGVEVNIGYMHRGIEELMQRKNYLQGIFLAERICGICSGIHSVTYCEAVENALGIEIPERAKYIRTITLELERLHSHFLFLGVMAYELGLDTGFMYTWRDREHVMDMLETLSGNRVNYGIPTIGGVRRDLPAGEIPGMLKRLEHLRKRAEHYVILFSSDALVRKRTLGKGNLPKGKANSHSIVGPVARASGVNTDIRRDLPYLLYDELEWNVVTRMEGDVQARVMVKAYEIFESISILKQCLNRISRTTPELKTKTSLFVKENEGMSITEAPRGELVYYLVSNGTDRPERMRIRTPTFTNVPSALPIILKGEQLADLPVIVGSVDPCFSCCDRVTIVDERTGESRGVDEAFLRKLGEENGD